MVIFVPSQGPVALPAPDRGPPPGEAPSLRPSLPGCAAAASVQCHQPSRRLRDPGRESRPLSQLGASSGDLVLNRILPPAKCHRDSDLTQTAWTVDPHDYGGEAGIIIFLVVPSPGAACQPRASARTRARAPAQAGRVAAAAGRRLPVPVTMSGPATQAPSLVPPGHHLAAQRFLACTKSGSPSRSCQRAPGCYARVKRKFALHELVFSGSSTSRRCRP